MSDADALTGLLHGRDDRERRTLDGARLAELQAAGLARMDWRSVFSISNPTCPCCEPTEEALAVMAPLAEYFRHFLPPGRCVCCGAQQGGNVLQSAFGIARFRWGLAHGEGSCSDCGYPARAYHRDVGPIQFLNMVLQYHPDELRMSRGAS